MKQIDNSKTGFLKASVLSLAVTLASCGGNDVLGPGFVNNAGVATSPVNIGALALVDTNNKILNSLTSEGALVKVKIVDGSEKPIPNAIVKFSIDGSGITLAQSTSGSFLTNADGIAQVYAKPDSANTTGAYTITATATKGKKTATEKITFSAQAKEVVLSELQFDQANIDSSGQTPFSIKVTDTANQPIRNISVSFEASCGDITEKQSSNSQGIVRGVYKSVNADGSLCEEKATIIANSGAATPVTSTVNIEKAQPTSIQYNAGAVVLGITGSGSASNGEAKFTVFSNTSPLPNVEVLLSLEKSPLGFSFGTQGNTQTFTAKTDDKGQVAVNLYPGGTPGPVEIKASIAGDDNKFALSKNISVASSRVTQKGFSLSLTTNVMSWDFDGEQAEYIARLSDRSGNPVPDGTVVSFTAEGGRITPNCATSGGNCTVSFSTQNFRPIEGRVSILAVVEGEKEFIDKNGNNTWDKTDEITHNIGDTFRDDDENDDYTEGDFLYTQSTTLPKGNCSNKNRDSSFVKPNIKNSCTTGLDAILRKQSIQLLSSENLIITPLSGKRFKVNSARYPNNPPPGGTTVNIESLETASTAASTGTGSTGTGTGSTGAAAQAQKNECKMFNDNPVPKIVNTGKPGDDLGVIYSYSGSNCKVTVTTPKGTKNVRLL